MKSVIRNKKKRQVRNIYGEKKKRPKGKILGPKLAATGPVDGFPVRGNRA